MLCLRPGRLTDPSLGSGMRSDNGEVRGIPPRPPAPRMSLAILLPTCDAYAPVARFTVKRLDACWPRHPEVFVCGIAGFPAPFGSLLPLAADPRDWVGITLDAVRCLQGQGVEWLYLILDDHTPFGPCNVDYLNQRLPENAAALGAIQVNLLGWDQYQPRQGVVLGPEHLFWERNDSSFRWKFSLHPGLWHVLTFRHMLESLRSSSPDVRSRPGVRRGDGRRLPPVSTRCFWSGPTACGAMASRRGTAGSSRGARGP